MKIKERRKYNCLFENEEKEELIHVWCEDENGYIVYECCYDPTRQIQRMTPVELFKDYTRVEI